MSRYSVILGAVVVVLLAGCTTEPSATLPAKMTAVGAYTTLAGQELYTFNGDAKDVPEGKWAPLYARSEDRGDSDFSIVSRPDGTLQWAFRDKPLYYFDGDDALRRSDPSYRSGAWKVLNNPYATGTGVASGGH